MDVSQCPLSKLFSGQEQYIVPDFQRPYDWDEADWKVLWKDLEDLMESAINPETAYTYIMGSLWVAQEKVSLPGDSVKRWVIIDGQQRLVTLQILLAVIRDEAKERGYDPNFTDQLENTQLHNPYQNGDSRYKVLPRAALREEASDRADFVRVIDGPRPEKGESRILRAYEFFKKKLRTKGVPRLNDFFSIMMHNTTFVYTVVDGRDNIYRIFEWINARGKQLTAAHHIRHYFYMVTSYARHAECTQCFYQIEDLIEEAHRTDFFHAYLVTLINRYIPVKDLYTYLQKQLNDKTEQDTVDFLRNIARASRVYQLLLKPSLEQDPFIQRKLQLFQKGLLSAKMAHPFLLDVLLSREKGLLDEEVVRDVFTSVENYLMRRHVCGGHRDAMKQLFSALYRMAASRTSLSFGQAVKEVLADQDYPSNEMFFQRLIHGKLYSQRAKGRKARPVLERLEEALGHKERIEIDGTITVEHVMPQTLTEAWKAYLGEDYERIYSQWVHTLGNLSMTGYNSEMQNALFEKKRPWLANSHFELNKAIATQNEEWREKEIKARGEALAHKALELWPDLNPVRDQKRQAVTGCSPETLYVLGEEFQISQWKLVLATTLEVIARKKAEAMPNIAGAFPFLISSSSNGMEEPRRLPNNYWYDAKYLSKIKSEKVRAQCVNMIQMAGASSEDWRVRTKEEYYREQHRTFRLMVEERSDDE